MRRRSLLLLASLALVSLGDGAPLNIMSAPNLLRVGTTENIFVECQGCGESDIAVTISVWSHHTNTRELVSTSVVLDSGNNHQAFGNITIPPDSLNADPRVKQYVYLKAQFEGKPLLQKVVLVSFQSGYIFIQTDQPLYTSGSTVLFRMFALTPQMKAVERTGAGGTNTTITVDMETPDGMVLPQSPSSLRSGIHAGRYTLPDFGSPGLWKLVARFQTNPQQSFYCHFQVKEYVLPRLEVKLEPVVPFFQVNSTGLTVNIRARYFIGEAVDGAAYVVVGTITNTQRKTFPNSLWRVPIHEGVGVVTLNRDFIKYIFNSPDVPIGGRMFMSVRVMTHSGKHRHNIISTCSDDSTDHSSLVL